MQSFSFVRLTASEKKIFSSPEPKAHKVSLKDGHDPASVRPASTISKIFSETTWPILLKFYVEPPWVVALKA